MVKIAEDYIEPPIISTRVKRAIKRAYRAIPKTKATLARARRVRRALAKPTKRLDKALFALAGMRVPRRPRRAVRRPRRAVGLRRPVAIDSRVLRNAKAKKARAKRNGYLPTYTAPQKAALKKAKIPLYK